MFYLLFNKNKKINENLGAIDISFHRNVIPESLGPYPILI
jgi:hypothetical protein